MTPTLDSTFKADLKKVCSDLDCRWSFEICRWVIFYNNPYNGQSYRIHEVKTPSGEYRMPDQRTIDMLRMADMSSKVEDVGYLMSEQYRNIAREKEIRKQKQREDLRKKAKDRLPLWKAALANADRGIFRDNQLSNKPVYSLPSYAMSASRIKSMQLLQKLGKPHLTGRVHEVHSESSAGPLIINP